jgi:hypothetical protein
MLGFVDAVPSESFPDVADQQSVRKGTDVEPIEPHFELSAVAGLDCCEICRLRLVELRLAHVGCGPPRDLHHAGVIDAEGAGGICECQLGIRARDKWASWSQ